MSSCPLPRNKSISILSHNFKIHVHEWNCFWVFLQTLNDCVSAPLCRPIWVNCALDCSTTFSPHSPSPSSTDYNGQHSLPQHLGMLPEPLLISQTNYSRFTTRQPLLTNGQLTDPHMPCIHCFVWCYASLVEIFTEHTGCPANRFFRSHARNPLGWL